MTVRFHFLYHFPDKNIFKNSSNFSHFLPFLSYLSLTLSPSVSTQIAQFVHKTSAASSPAKPRTTSKYDPSNGNQTVGPSSGGGIMQRRSTRLLEKTLSSEKTSALPPEQK